MSITAISFFTHLTLVKTLASTWLVKKIKDLTMSANVVLLIPEKHHETTTPIVETEIRGTKFLFFHSIYFIYKIALIRAVYWCCLRIK